MFFSAFGLCNLWYLRWVNRLMLIEVVWQWWRLRSISFPFSELISWFSVFLVISILTLARFFAKVACPLLVELVVVDGVHVAALRLVDRLVWCLLGHHLIDLSFLPSLCWARSHVNTHRSSFCLRPWFFNYSVVGCVRRLLQHSISWSHCTSVVWRLSEISCWSRWPTVIERVWHHVFEYTIATFTWIGSSILKLNSIIRVLHNLVNALLPHLHVAISLIIILTIIAVVVVSVALLGLLHVLGPHHEVLGVVDLPNLLALVLFRRTLTSVFVFCRLTTVVTSIYVFWLVTDQSRNIQSSCVVVWMFHILFWRNGILH